MQRSTEILITASALALIYIIYKKTRSRANAPPSLPWLPIVGSLPFLSSAHALPIDFLQKTKRYGNVYSFYAGNRYTVVLNGYAAIREALIKKSKDFAGRDKAYAETHVWNPEYRGIGFRQYNDYFKTIRRTSIVVMKKLGYGERATMETKIHEEVTKCIKYIQEKDGKPFDMEPILRVSILNIIYNLLFGKSLQLEDPILEFITSWLSHYEKSLDPALDLFPVTRFLPKFQKMLHDIVPHAAKLKKSFSEEIEKCLNTSCEDENFITEYLKQSGSDFDQSELFFITRDLFSGGANSGPIQLLWAIVLINNHPTVKDRLHTEIDSVVPRDRLPSLSDKLPYLEAVILEVMRLKLVIPLAVPHKTLSDTEVAGFFIPANTQVIVNLWSAHMDPSVWESPEEFRPERFLNDSNEIINRDLVISFSLGKRSCPGEILARHEIFLLLASLLQQFDILPPEGQQNISDHGVISFIYSPDPFHVRLLPRTK